MAEIIDTDTVCNEYLEDGEHILWSQVPEDNRLHLNGGIPGIVFGSVLLIAGAAVFIVLFKIFDVVQAVMACRALSHVRRCYNVGEYKKGLLRLQYKRYRQYRLPRQAVL